MREVLDFPLVVREIINCIILEATKILVVRGGAILQAMNRSI